MLIYLPETTVLGLILSLEYCLYGVSCVLLVFTWVSARLSGFLPTVQKKHTGRQFGGAKFPLGQNVCRLDAFSPCIWVHPSCLKPDQLWWKPSPQHGWCLHGWCSQGDEQHGVSNKCSDACQLFFCYSFSFLCIILKEGSNVFMSLYRCSTGSSRKSLACSKLLVPTPTHQSLCPINCKKNVLLMWEGQRRMGKLV